MSESFQEERPADEEPAATTTPDMSGQDPVLPAGPSAALDQDDPVAPEDVEDSDELAAKGLADFPPPTDLPHELLTRVNDLAPQPPQGLQDADRERWALCSRIAAMIAIDQFDGDPDAELRKFAWSLARTMFNDPETYPMDDPSAAQTEPAEPDAAAAA